MEGMIGWILLVPGLYFLLFGRVFGFHGFFEIPSDQFYVRSAGATFIVAGLLFQMDLLFGLIGVIAAIVLLIISIVMAVRDMKPRPQDHR